MHGHFLKTIRANNSLMNKTEEIISHKMINEFGTALTMQVNLALLSQHKLSRCHSHHFSLFGTTLTQNMAPFLCHKLLHSALIFDTDSSHFKFCETTSQRISLNVSTVLLVSVVAFYIHLFSSHARYRYLATKISHKFQLLNVSNTMLYFLRNRFFPPC
jgi:hypothetical protein